jgi:hypothetical protein
MSTIATTIRTIDDAKKSGPRLFAFKPATGDSDGASTAKQEFLQ